MRLKLQVKISRLAGVPLVSRVVGQTTADRRTTRRKWSPEENRVVRQCYYRSEYGRNGYKKRMQVIWNETGMFNVHVIFF